MIVFNGVSIMDIAPVEIADIVVSTVKRSVVTRDRPILPGAEFVRVTDGTRQVTITLAVLTNDAETRISEIEAINAWAASTEPGRLVLPYQGGKYLTALCTSFVEPSYRQWWENKLKLVFTAFDPYFNAPGENSLALGTAANIGGSAEPLVRIETVLGSSVSSLAWTDGTNTLTLSGTIPAGTVTVDLSRQTIMHSNGSSLSNKLTLASRFPTIKRVMDITSASGGTLIWRERYV